MAHSLLAAVACLAVSFAHAQTFTNCNPLNVTCPGDLALGTSYSQNFTTTVASDKIWNATSGQVAWNSNGGQFTINAKGDSPTIQSNFYIFFGRVSTIMQAAPGTGIVSSVVMQSDDLDEIDWEFLGGNSTHASLNFFGKGNTTSYDRATWSPINNNQALHNYTTVWTNTSIEWWVDDAMVRTLSATDSLANYGKNYPQTPMFVKIGIWAGGDPTMNNAGTVEWAGGDVDYSKGPYTMTVQNVEVHDYSSGSMYTYGDKSGSWQSIQIKEGNSMIANHLITPPTLQERLEALPRNTKIGAAIGAIGGIALIFALLTICCIRRRKARRQNRVKADAQYEYYLSETNKDQAESRKLDDIVVGERHHLNSNGSDRFR